MSDIAPENYINIGSLPGEATVYSVLNNLCLADDFTETLAAPIANFETIADSPNGIADFLPSINPVLASAFDYSFSSGVGSYPANNAQAFFSFEATSGSGVNIFNSGYVYQDDYTPTPILYSTNFDCPTD